MVFGSILHLLKWHAKKNLFFKLKTAPYFFSVLYYYFSQFLGNIYFKFNEVSAEYIVHRYIKNETLRKVLLDNFQIMVCSLMKQVSLFTQVS